MSRTDWLLIKAYLSTIIVTKTDGTLATQSIRPESTEVNVGLSDLGMGQEQPDAEDGLGEDVQNGVGDNLSINRESS